MILINVPVSIAILDDYQNIALEMADWSSLDRRATIMVFNDHLADPDRVVERLLPFDAVCVMRERTEEVRSVQIETSRPISTTASTGSLKYSVRWAELRCMKAKSASTNRGKAFSSSPGTTVSWPT
jgi:hypothetical protein